MKWTTAFMPLLIALPGLLSCTGINIGRLYPATANTNPAQDYAYMYTPVYRGGAIYHGNTVPGQLGYNYNKANLTGKACSYSILWLVSFGDSTIKSAKEDGRITRVRSVDHEVLGILGFVFHRHCTIVTGSEEPIHSRGMDQPARSADRPVEKKNPPAERMEKPSNGTDEPVEKTEPSDDT